MKKFSLWLFATIAIVFTIIFSSSPLQTTKTYAEDISAYYEYVYDDANLFTNSEKATINEAAGNAQYRTKGKCDFYIGTYDGILDDETGNNFLYNHLISTSQNSVLLLVANNSGEYHYWLYTYGDATKKINDSEVDRLLDDPLVYDNLKEGRLEEGCVSFLNLAPDCYNTNYVKVFFISFAISLVVATIACAGVISKYKKLRKVADYPLDKFTKTNITGKNDVLVNTFVTKTRIKTNSNNGGSHSGGGGGGGHSRGGR